MLTRTAFTARFSARAVFGMVHLGALPGAPLFASLDEVIEHALRDACALRDGGCDGFVVENFGDRPFTRGRVEAETVAAMTRVIAEITAVVRLPFGVNVLRNDALSALAIAAATGAAFIRVNVHTGAMLTDQGIIEGDAYATLRKRASLAPDVLIFADHLVKHATPLADVDPLQSARDLRLRGLADALIVTGAETGAAADPARLRMLRDAFGRDFSREPPLTRRFAPPSPLGDEAAVGRGDSTGEKALALGDEAAVRRDSTGEKALALGDEAAVGRGDSTGEKALALGDQAGVGRGDSDAPLLLGSGLTASNARDFADADGAIVGTSVKRDGAVDATLVQALLRAFK